MIFFRVVDPRLAVLEVSNFLYTTSQLAQTTLRMKVTLVEAKQIELAEQVIRAIARQAEAERERRAKVTHAEGEYLAADKLAMAAAVIQQQPAAIQLRSPDRSDHFHDTRAQWREAGPNRDRPRADTGRGTSEREMKVHSGMGHICLLQSHRAESRRPRSRSTKHSPRGCRVVPLAPN